MQEMRNETEEVRRVVDVTVNQKISRDGGKNGERKAKDELQAPIAASNALFGILFENGTYHFDLWPKNASEAIGRPAIFAWKTCYPEQGIPDMFHIGRIVAVDGDRVEINQGAGSSRVLLDHVFLLPLSATGCLHNDLPTLGYSEFHLDAENRVARGERQHYCAACGRFIWAEFWPNVRLDRHTEPKGERAS